MQRSLIIGAVVAVVVGFLAGFASAAAGSDDSWTPAMVGAFAGIFAGYISNNLAGTRKSPAVSDELRQQWLSFTVPDDRSALYVVRSGFVAKLAGMDVAVDGASVAQLRSPEFTCIDLVPGRHDVAISMLGGAGSQSRAAQHQVDCAAGRVIVLHATMAMGAVKNSLELREVAGEQARALLEKAKAVEPGRAP